MKFTSKHACLGLAEIDRTIVEALRYALEELFPEMMQTYHITERNGYGQYKWNFIIAQLKAVCSHLGWIDNGLCQRAAWKLPVLFYEKTRVLITFMTEDTFVKIQKRSDKGKHYLTVLPPLIAMSKLYMNNSNYNFPKYHLPKKSGLLHLRNNLLRLLTVMLVKLLGMYSFYLMCMPTAC